MLKLRKNDMTYYLKAKIIKVPQELFIIQQNYALKVICHFNLQGYQFISTPMVERLKLKIDMNEDIVDPIYYYFIVGKFIQLSYF